MGNASDSPIILDTAADGGRRTMENQETGTSVRQEIDDVMSAIDNRAFAQSPDFGATQGTQGGEEPSQAPSAQTSSKPSESGDADNEEPHPAVLHLQQENASLQEEKERLLGKRDELLRKNQKLKDYRQHGSPDEVAEKMRELEEFRTAKSAKEVGTDESRFRDAVEARTAEVKQILTERFEPMVEKRNKQIAELKEQAASLEQANRRLELQNLFPEVNSMLHDGVGYMFWPTASEWVRFEGPPEMRTHKIVHPDSPGTALPNKDNTGDMQFPEFVQLLAKRAPNFPSLFGLFRDKGSGAGVTSAPAGSQASGSSLSTANLAKVSFDDFMDALGNDASEATAFANRIHEAGRGR